MKVHTTTIEPIHVVDRRFGGDDIVVSIETYYDPHLRLWTAIADDADGFQVLGAMYGMTQEEALGEMRRELRANAKDPEPEFGFGRNL